MATWAATDCTFVYDPTHGGSSRAPIGTVPVCHCPDPTPVLEDTARSSLPVGTGTFGIDVDMIDDVPLRWALAGGFRNLGNALARRVMFLREYLNAGLTQEELDNLRSRVTAAIEADERVAHLSQLGFELNLQTQILTVNILVETSDGPFRFIMAVDALTVEIIDGKTPS